jgi:hypothetical protein
MQLITIHPKGELEIHLNKREMAALDGNHCIERYPQAQVTPLGQLPFLSSI